MKKNIKKIFDQIEETRRKNNSNWMDLLRLSYESSPKKTIIILNKILKKDQNLIRLAKSLTRKK